MIDTEIVARLCSLMDKRVNVQFNTSPDLKEIAESLAIEEAEPRDLIRVYYETLKTQLNIHNDDVEKSQMYIENGRLMLLEMMGYLAQYYRSLALGLSKSIEGAKMLLCIKEDIKKEILKELKGN